MLTSVQGSGGSRSFAKQTRTLKMRNAVAGHWKLSMTNWEADPLIQEVAKKFSINHSMIVMQIGKVRNVDKWVSHELTAIKKIVILKCRLLLFYAIITKHFSMRLWHIMKNGFYMTTGNNQLSGWTERKLQSPFQSQTCTKKNLWSLFGGLLLVWSTTAFWIPVKPLHLRSMLSKSMRCTENWNACSWHWSTEWAQFFSMTTSDSLLYNNASKVKQIGLQSFASSAIFTWPLANELPLLQASWQLSAGKTLPQPAGHRKCFPRVCQIPKHRFLCYRNKQTYFSLAKMCWL